MKIYFFNKINIHDIRLTHILLIFLKIKNIIFKAYYFYNIYSLIHKLFCPTYLNI